MPGHRARPFVESHDPSMVLDPAASEVADRLWAAAQPAEFRRARPILVSTSLAMNLRSGRARKQGRNPAGL